MAKKRNRRAPQVTKKLRVFCEGEKTEPYYLKGYIRHFRNDHKATIEIMDCTKNTPVQLVEAAIRCKNSNKSIEGDEFWVAYDREAVSKYTRRLHLEAWENARNNGINIALSNICFEFWLLLHFVDSSTSYSSFANLKKNSNLLTEVKNCCGQKYDKASAVLFEAIKENIQPARDRAIRINAAGLKGAGHKCEPFDINPYTDMPKLLDAIDRF